MNEKEIQEALRTLIQGKSVRRGVHSLTIEDKNVTDLFVAALKEEGFGRMRVEEVSVERGRRAPAFYIEENTASFGWVFWELFTPDRARKIFGSVDRNAKGDWALMLGRKEEIYANPLLAEEMDVEHPSEF